MARGPAVPSTFIRGQRDSVSQSWLAALYKLWKRHNMSGEFISNFHCHREQDDIKEEHSAPCAFFCVPVWSWKCARGLFAIGNLKIQVGGPDHGSKFLCDANILRSSICWCSLAGSLCKFRGFVIIILATFTAQFMLWISLCKACLILLRFACVLLQKMVTTWGRSSQANPRFYQSWFLRALRITR